MVKVSIVIPVYNALPYLNECIESIKSQTFTDWEAICVDDCSTDESYAELLKYAEKDSRIKVYQMPENSGSGPARNLALDKANGDYILFMDPDDLYPRNDVIEKLYNAISKSKTGLAGGNVLKFDEQKEWREKTSIVFSNDVISVADYPRSIEYWRFMYRRKLLDDNNIRFPDYRRRQDPVFLTNVLSSAENIACIEENSYKYRKDHKSLTLNKRKLQDIIRSHKDCLNTYDRNKMQGHLKFEKQNFLTNFEYNYLPQLFTVKEISIADFAKIFSLKQISSFLIFKIIIKVILKLVIRYIKDNMPVSLKQSLIPVYRFICLPKVDKSSLNKQLLLQKDSCKGKRCFIVGTAPSINKMDLSKLKNEYTFTVNRGFLLQEKGLENIDFYGISDQNAYDSYGKDIKPDDFKHCLVIGDIKWELAKDNISVFDLYTRNTLLKKLNKGFFQFDISKPLANSSTVVLHMLQIAVWLGFKEIYFIGVDNNFSGKNMHFYKDTKEEKSNMKVFDDPCLRNAQSFAKADEILRKRDIKIYNAGVNGSLNEIKRVNYESLFND